MIYTLRVKCVFMNEDCIRTIEIPEGFSLYDLHEAIQEAVDFDKDHLFEFFMARTPRGKKIRFADEEDWEYVETSWHDIRLHEIFPLKGVKLYYLFDFGDNWLFEIRKERKVKEPEHGVEYPRVVKRIGDNPEQYSM